MDSGLSSALNIILKGGGGWIGGVAFQTQKAERERSTDSVCVESFSSILWFLISDWFFFLGGATTTRRPLVYSELLLKSAIIHHFSPILF